MSDHKTALVPVEAWCYASPELLDEGQNVDIGLFAEALIYYDVVTVLFTSPSNFESFLRWFFESGHLSELISLIDAGFVRIYYSNFTTPPLIQQGIFTVYMSSTRTNSSRHLRKDTYALRHSIGCCLNILKKDKEFATQ